jgi:predicted transcriptional regulator
MDLPTPRDLRERRLELGLTQSELAERADVSQPLIARIEGGDVDPRLSTLRGIVTALEEAKGGIVRAADLMHEDVISVAPNEQVKRAVERMQREGYSQLAVIQEGIPVGSISESDVVHAGENAGEKPVREVMSESFPTVGEDATLSEIGQLLDHYKAVMVTEAGETVGIITEADLAAKLS